MKAGQKYRVIQAGASVWTTVTKGPVRRSLTAPVPVGSVLTCAGEFVTDDGIRYVGWFDAKGRPLFSGAPLAQFYPLAAGTVWPDLTYLTPV